MKSKTEIYDHDRRPPGNITLDRFDNSLNFYWGIAVFTSDFDVLNNPYLVYSAY